MHKNVEIILIYGKTFYMAQNNRTFRVSQFTGLMVPQSFGNVSNFGIAHTLQWLTRKTGYSFSDAEKLDPTLSISRPKFSVEALRVDAGNEGFFWMLQFKHPDSIIKEREWVTEIAIGENAARQTRFGVRLNYTEPVSEPPQQNATFSIPGIFREMAKTPGIVIDGKKIGPTPTEIGDQEALEDFIALAESQLRRLPIVMISENYQDGYLFDAADIAKKLEGVAHIFEIPHGFTFHLTDRWGRGSSAHGGAARILIPSSDLETSGLNKEHPFFLPRNGSGDISRLTHQIIQNAFRANLGIPVSESELPSYASVKKVFFYQASRTLQAERAEQSRQVRGTDQAATTPATIESIVAQRETDLIRERSLLEKMRAASEEEVQTALSLAAEEEARRKEAETENKKLAQQVADMTAQIAALSKSQPKVTKTEVSIIFPPLSEVQRWAHSMFPKELLITRRAAKAVLSSVYADPDLIYQSLILLARYKRNMHLYIELSDKEGKPRNLPKEFEERADQLHLQDGISISQLRAAQFGDIYYVTHEGERFFLDRHLKRGGTRDPKRCFRLYYTFDQNSERIIVGHMPSHLENSLT